VTVWLLAIGRMLGLGSIAGIRPSLTLAVIGVVSYSDWGIHTNSTFSWLSHWLAIGIFVVLAILESAFDKIPKVDRLQDRLIMPYRLVMGGVAGAATIPFGWKGIVIGAAVGAGASWFAQYAKHLSRPKSVPSEAVRTLISVGEDLGAFLGSVAVLAVPYFGYACVGVTGFVYWRVRDRRRAKYRQMRRTAPRALDRTPKRASGPPREPVPPGADASSDDPGPGFVAPGAFEQPGTTQPEAPPEVATLESGVKSAGDGRGDDGR
jgi:uncharacterized membrane protein